MLMSLKSTHISYKLKVHEIEPGDTNVSKRYTKLTKESTSLKHLGEINTLLATFSLYSLEVRPHTFNFKKIQTAQLVHNYQ